MNSQVLPGTPVAGIPSGTTAQINSIPSPIEGLMAYSTDDDTIYYYNGTAWVTFTDDQTASEVNSNTPVDVDGDSTTETTVEDVIQDIAPITSKAARVFYPPSIAIDASTTGTGFTINLYTQYTAQFASPVASNPGASGTIPVYAAAELDYYVTFADPAVFANISISNTGVMTYDIIASPLDFNSLINVVFVVK